MKEFMILKMTAISRLQPRIIRLPTIAVTNWAKKADILQIIMSYIHHGLKSISFFNLIGTTVDGKGNIRGSDHVKGSNFSDYPLFEKI